MSFEPLVAGQIALLGDHKSGLAGILSEAEAKVTALSEQLASAKAIETDQAARVASLEGRVGELEQGREAADKARAVAEKVGWQPEYASDFADGGTLKLTQRV